MINTVGFFIHRRQDVSPLRVHISFFLNREPLEIRRQLAQRSIINVLCGGATDIERHGTLGRLLAGSNRCAATPEAVISLAILPQFDGTILGAGGVEFAVRCESNRPNGSMVTLVDI